MKKSAAGPVTKSPEYECARHNAVRGDSKLVGLFLCDSCSDLFIKNLFNGTKSAYDSEPIEKGYCVYCGEAKTVRERFWFLCTICERIVRSYAAEKAASEFILSWWKGVRKNNVALRHVQLEYTDPVRLMSFQVHKDWKKASKEIRPDFIGINEDDKKKNFAIEMKTGRSAINKMSAFQLDVTDCDDILAFLKELRIPSYLLHVQVVEEYKPPTSKKLAINAWWISVFDMEIAFQSTRIRQREQRPAAFFRRRYFKPLESFPEHLMSEKFHEQEQLARNKLPKLYELREPTSTRTLRGS